MATKDTGTRFEDVKATVLKRKKIYVRCHEGAEIYSICPNTVRKLAREAKAIRKVKKAGETKKLRISMYITILMKRMMTLIIILW